jgi:diguanylate cyclase (GGDEF)-like protein
MRETDLVARYGGEEFVFCLLGMDESRAARFCEELRQAVESHAWAELSPGLQVTVSIGLAARRDEATVQALLERADACLYRAKHLGRNRVVARDLVVIPSGSCSTTTT